jgi:thiol-disulfide isomerase/thioredoxin
LGKSQKKRPGSSPRPAQVEHRPTQSWVKRGHKKLYLLSGLVLVAIILGAWALSASPAKGALRVGDSAPEFTFMTMDGSPSSLSAYRGRPVVLWLITTWCTSCQDGTKLFAQNYYNQYHTAGVVLLEIESYRNLGQPGPSLDNFAQSYGYSRQTDWILGEGSQDSTTIYNSAAYLDYFYAVSSQGIIIDAKPELPQYFGAVLQEAHSR